MMPIILQNDKLRFCRVQARTKKPFEKDWTNKPYTWKEIEPYIQQGENFGVLCGYGDLAVIDVDHESLRLVVDTMLPKTFKVKTGSGGLHAYFYVPGLKQKIILEIGDGNGGTIHLGEIQSHGTQVVGPESIHPNGNKYEVLENIPIATLQLDKVTEVFSQFMKKKPKTLEEFRQEAEQRRNEEMRDFGSEIDDLNVLDIWGAGGLKNHGEEFFGSHPIHGSAGGMNFWINTLKNAWSCFRCNSGGGVLSAIAVKEGLISCSEAQPGRIRGELARKCIEIAKEKYGLKLKPPESMMKPIREDRTIECSEWDKVREEVYMALLEKDKRKASEIIVQSILDKYHIYTTKEDTKSETWVYNNGIYVPQGKSEIKRVTRLILEKAFTTHLCNEVINKIEADTFIDKDEFFGHNYIKEVPILDGIFNLITRDLQPFTPSKIFFNKLPVHYNPGAVCPNIDNHFKTVLKTEDDAEVLYEWIGFCLWKDYFLEKSLMFVGDGRNGKGKTIDLIKRFIGLDNCVSIPLSEINSNSFRVSELFGKMVNLAGDLPNISVKDTGLFKQTTGRDMIGAKRKFLTALNFTNYAKHVFACNELPRVYDATKGFWSRWILFEFPFTFLDKSEFDKLTEKEREQKKVKLMDPDHIQKISTQEELDGLFLKALDGLDRIRSNKEFSYSQGSDEIQKFWVRKSDSFMAFVLDHLDEDPTGQITKEELRLAYHKYNKEHGLKGSGDKNIKAVLQEQFGATEHYTPTDSGRRVWVWSGVRFKESSKFSYSGGKI